MTGFSWTLIVQTLYSGGIIRFGLGEIATEFGFKWSFSIKSSMTESESDVRNQVFRTPVSIFTFTERGGGGVKYAGHYLPDSCG